MALTREQLRTLTKQALGNRSSSIGITIDDPWYNDRVNSGYRRLCTFQGVVSRPGLAQPQYRLLRFFELEARDARTYGLALANNFVTPFATGVVYVMDVYDRTTNVGLRRASRREILGLDPDAIGRPTRWCPSGSGGVAGYYIDKRPGVAADNISVYEYTYKYPVELSTDTGSTGTPIIPDAWHTAIWYAAAAEGAALLEWPEKAQEYESKFMQFIAERKSPQEEAAYSGLAGPRRNVPVGRTW